MIKRRWGNWWLKYNFVFSSALDVGLALSGSIISFVYNTLVPLSTGGGTKFSTIRQVTRARHGQTYLQKGPLILIAGVNLL